MVPSTHIVGVCVMKGWTSTHLVVTGEKTHTVVPYAHPVVVCVVKGGGGGRTPGEHGALKVVFQYCFVWDRPTQWFCLPTQWLFVL